MNHADWMKYVGQIRIAKQLNNASAVSNALGIKLADAERIFIKNRLTVNFLEKIISIDPDKTRALEMEGHLLNFEEMMRIEWKFPFAKEAAAYMLNNLNLYHLRDIFPKLSPLFNEIGFKSFLVSCVNLANIGEDLSYTSIMNDHLEFTRSKLLKDGTEQEGSILGAPPGLEKEFLGLNQILYREYSVIRNLLVEQGKNV